MWFKRLRKWRAKREAIKHMKHTAKCGDWHEVRVMEGVIYCSSCSKIFWNGMDKKAMEELRVDAKNAAFRLEHDCIKDKKERARKQELVRAVLEVERG